MERSYFQAIEEAFIRLRGAPLLLSPADWQLAKEWFDLGIPAGFVIEALDQVFALRAEQGKTGRVHSLRYCADTVLNAWRDTEELIAPAQRTPPPEPRDLRQAISRIASSLPDDLPGRDTWAARIEACYTAETSAEDIETALAVVEGALLEDARQRLSPAQSQAVLEQSSRAVAELAERLTPAQRDLLKQRLARRLLRRELGLPPLSLFAGD